MRVVSIQKNLSPSSRRRAGGSVRRRTRERKNLNFEPDIKSKPVRPLYSNLGKG